MILEVTTSKITFYENMIIYQRTIEAKIRTLLDSGKIILIFGPRQSGKTTLAKRLIESYGDSGKYFSCESNFVRNKLIMGEPELLLELFADGTKIIVLDEAQTVENIGKILKVFYDTYPGRQIIATGSSSFDLANKVIEPLTGRTFEFTLYPLSLSEIEKTTHKKTKDEDIEEYIVYGMYPGIRGAQTDREKYATLTNIATNYLYKDIYALENIRKPKLLEDILKLVASQVGSIVSITELAKTLVCSKDTVERYITFLEQAYVIKRLYVYTESKRGELRRPFKIFFTDLGIRNAFLPNLDPIPEREDKGALFENFVFTEFLKQNASLDFPPRMYFWRTDRGLEIDFLLKKGASTKAYECKYTEEYVPFNLFKKRYPNAETHIITRNTILDFFT